MSLAEWVDEVRPGPKLERMARAIGIGLFAVDDINDASAWECFKFLSRVVSRGHAIGYPAGGWRAVIDALRRPIDESDGAELRLSSRVEEIEVKGGRAAGVRLADGEKLSAETVVWAAPVQALPAALPAGSLDKEAEKFFLGMRSTFGVNVDFALRKPVSREKRCIVTLDPPTLGWFVSNVEPSVAPRGKQLLTVFSPISPEDWPDRKFRDKRRDALRDTCFAMFPEIENEVLWERPLDTLVNAARGDTGQTSRLRPGHTVDGVDGLLLIGDSTGGRGFGGEISADSALRVFKMLEKAG
ncbi:MAG: FAD-dependent oxidoreductase, partial [bacterium]